MEKILEYCDVIASKKYSFNCLQFVEFERVKDLIRENLGVLDHQHPALWHPAPCNIRGACLGKY